MLFWGLFIIAVLLVLVVGGWLLVFYDPMPELQVQAPVVETQDENKPKDISEPVISFVECVRNNRKRFIFNRTEFRVSNKYSYDCDREITASYLIEDKISRENWNVKVIYGYENEEILRTFKFPDFLTPDETIYLIESINEIYARYAKTMNNRRKVISERKWRDRDLIKQKERDRLKTIYCVEKE